MVVVVFFANGEGDGGYSWRHFGDLFSEFCLNSIYARSDFFWQMTKVIVVFLMNENGDSGLFGE